MAIIHPFQGFRPQQSRANKVASRPYDVLNRVEAKVEAQDNPYSFLHIIRAEIDLPDDINSYDSQVYAKSKDNFAKFVAEGTLVQDEETCLYIYAQTMNGKQQIGLVTCLSIDDYRNDVIKKHEFTRPAKEKDRITHIQTTRLHSGPVLMAYKQVAEIDALIQKVILNQPTYDFTAIDGIQHTFWVVQEKAWIDKVTALFSEKVPAIYIADGHHRAASSTKVGLAERAKNPNYTGQEEYNFFLSVLFPDNQLQIIDYNRVVKDLNGLSKSDFLAKLATNFSIEAKFSPCKPQQARQFTLYLDKQWYLLTTKSHICTSDDPVASLDISLLSKYVLDEILGIKDQRTDDRIDFVGGIRGLNELEKRVDSGEMVLAFAIYPVSIEQLFKVADSGNVMPPKSTWFEPKLRSGLVVHQF